MPCGKEDISTPFDELAKEGGSMSGIHYSVCTFTLDETCCILYSALLIATERSLSDEWLVDGIPLDISLPRRGINQSRSILRPNNHSSSGISLQIKY